MKIKHFLCFALTLCATAARAQQTADKLDWVEDKALAAPAYSKEQLISIDMPAYVSMHIGIDPATISVGQDGVVRYVVVMRNTSGSTTAAYEGIRCTTDEVKTYARIDASDHWVYLSEPRWKAINDNMPSKHAFAIARQGACDTHLSTSREETIKLLTRKQKASR